MANVLIVEDDIDLNNAYKIVLENEGHVVVSAYNGQEALDALLSFEPDLIILDLLMPIKSGVEFLEDYRDLGETSAAKVLVFTNLENAPEINKAFQLGADKCIVKAWTGPQGMIEVVRQIIKGTKSSSVTPTPK